MHSCCPGCRAQLPARRTSAQYRASRKCYTQECGGREHDLAVRLTCFTWSSPSLATKTSQYPACVAEEAQKRAEGRQPQQPQSFAEPGGATGAGAARRAAARGDAAGDRGWSRGRRTPGDRTGAPASRVQEQAPLIAAASQAPDQHVRSIEVFTSGSAEVEVKSLSTTISTASILASVGR